MHSLQCVWIPALLYWLGGWLLGRQQNSQQGWSSRSALAVQFPVPVWFASQLGKPYDALIFSLPRGFLCHLDEPLFAGVIWTCKLSQPWTRLSASSSSVKLIVQTLYLKGDFSQSRHNLSIYIWQKQNAFCEHTTGHTRHSFALQYLVALNKVERAKLWRHRVWRLILPLFSTSLH